MHQPAQQNFYMSPKKIDIIQKSKIGGKGDSKNGEKEEEEEEEEKEKEEEKEEEEKYDDDDEKEEKEKEEDDDDDEKEEEEEEGHQESDGEREGEDFVLEKLQEGLKEGNGGEEDQRKIKQGEGKEKIIDINSDQAYTKLSMYSSQMVNETSTFEEDQRKPQRILVLAYGRYVVRTYIGAC